MALAILKLLDKSPNRIQFYMDTGSSPWWELVIGEAVTQQGGTDFIDGAQKRLPIRGPEANSIKTGRTIQLDPAIFNNERRFIQLFTYKTKNKQGEAFSAVIEVMPKLLSRKPYNSDDLPDIRIPENFSFMSEAPTIQPQQPFDFEETPLSGPMSFASLMPLITNLLPIATNLLGGLMSKGGGNSSNGTGTAAPAAAPAIDLKSLLTPENIKAVTDLITALMKENKTAVAKSLSGTVSSTLLGASSAIAPVLNKLMTKEAIAAIGGNPEKLYAAIADAIVKLPDQELMAVKQELTKLRPMEATLKHPPTVYSEAKIAPALLAAIPALMPLAEKAMDPNVINAIGDQPNKLLGTVQNGLLNFNKEQYRHIEAMMPKGVNMDDVIKQMIGSISAYNMITHMQPQAAPMQPVAQSVIVNALCNTVPLVEKTMSLNSIDEITERTSDMAEKISNELLQLQEDLKKKISKMVPELKIKKMEELPTESLSFSHDPQEFVMQGNRIFGNRPQKILTNGHEQGIQLFRKTLPVAIASEYRRQRNSRSRAAAFSIQEQPATPAAAPDPAAELLQQQIEAAEKERPAAMSVKTGREYDLEIVGAKTTDVNGTPKVIYVRDKGIVFAIKINGKSPLHKAMAQVQIRDHRNKLVAEKKFPLSNVQPGAIIDQLRFEPQELNGLPANHDLLVHIAFAWKEKSQTKAVRKTHAILISDGYTLGRIGEPVQTGIPLNNVNTHRNFWHKIWESPLTSLRSEVHIVCKYYMHYNPRAVQNAQIETRKQENQKEEEHSGRQQTFIKMKTGMDLSAVALNNLMPLVSPYPSLNEHQLKALRHYEFKKLVDTAAQSQLSFRNKNGVTNSLWVYPEVDLIKLTLKKANEINPYGNVLSTMDEEVVFARPSSLHFIGTQNK